MCDMTFIMLNIHTPMDSTLSAASINLKGLRKNEYKKNIQNKGDTGRLNTPASRRLFEVASEVVLLKLLNRQSLESLM